MDFFFFCAWNTFFIFPSPRAALFSYHFSCTKSDQTFRRFCQRLNIYCILRFLFLPPPFFVSFKNTSFTSSFVFLKVSSHSEPSSQSLSLQQSAQAPPPPQQPQYGLPVPESRDKQLCFSDFEDLSASFRSLYKCVFEQSFSQQGECQPHCGLLMPACPTIHNT